MKWFGQPWGAHVCVACERVDIPIGEMCVECHEPIQDGDSGFVVPYMTYPVRKFEEVVYHYACFIRSFTPSMGKVNQTYIQGEKPKSS